MADEYQHALAEPGTDKAVLESVQRGWVSGRDDCWKPDDVRRCVLESYQTRLVELKGRVKAVDCAVLQPV